MASITLNDSFSDDPRMLKLRRNERWIIIEMLCYCARHHRKHLPGNYQQVNKHFTKTVAEKCVQAHILEPAEDGWNLYFQTERTYSDPTNALRQQRYRNKHRNGNSNAVTVTDSNALPVTLPPTRARDDVLQTNTTTTNTPLDQQLAAIGVNQHTRQRALTENPARVQACLDAARRNGRNPAALFASLLTSGEWPLESAQGEATAMIDVNEAVERWLSGVGWDDTFDEDAIREQIDRMARSGRYSGEPDRERLVGLWRNLKPHQAKRFAQATPS